MLQISNHIPSQPVEIHLVRTVFTSGIYIVMSHVDVQYVS